MALRVRNDHFKADTGIVTEHIYRTSRLVSALTGIAVQPNKAIVAKTPSPTSRGSIRTASLKSASTYEIMTPQSIGVPQSRLVLGKHSGRHAFRERLRELGYNLDASEIEKAYQRFIELADRKKHVTDRDIQAIVEEEIVQVPELFNLEYLHVTTGTTAISTATVRIAKGDEIKEEAATGDGPVDAVYRAIDRVTQYRDGLGKLFFARRNVGKGRLGRGSGPDSRQRQSIHRPRHEHGCDRSQRSSLFAGDQSLGLRPAG